MDNEEKTSKKKLFMGLGVGSGAVIIIVLIIVLIMNGPSLGGLSQKDAAAKAENFVNTDLLSGQGGATVAVVGSEGDLYKLQIAYQGQKIDSYMTKDGKLFFPQVFNMASSTAATQPSASSGNQAPVANAPKSDKPVVELFVMSYCPYGTQIEKGIIPAVQALGNKIDFKLKFVSYTMHGDKENQENLRQYCINKDQGGKYLSYLTCFLKSSDAAACLQSNSISAAGIQSCMDSAGKSYDVTGTNFSIYKADNEKYGVQGSPTLVINGATVSSARDSASLLKTICGAFNNAPSACNTQLSSAAPAPGFGEGTATGGSTAAAGCATPTN